MRKAVFVLVFTAIVAGCVWFAVRRFPQPGQPGVAPPTAVAPGESLSVPPMLNVACGVPVRDRRWAVKTLSDLDRDRVRLSPIDATVEDLVALERPPELLPNRRAVPVETTVYRVEARLVESRREGDGDVHLILVGLRVPSDSMIAEIPDSRREGACRSGLAEEYGEARQAFETWHMAHRGHVEAIVTVVGVGFFDHDHGQRGAARNNIELHPVLSIQFP